MAADKGVVKKNRVENNQDIFSQKDWAIGPCTKNYDIMTTPKACRFTLVGEIVDNLDVTKWQRTRTL